jgi:hypothetical protein
LPLSKRAGTADPCIDADELARWALDVTQPSKKATFKKTPIPIKARVRVEEKESFAGTKRRKYRIVPRKAWGDFFREKYIVLFQTELDQGRLKLRRQASVDGLVTKEYFCLRSFVLLGWDGGGGNGRGTLGIRHGFSLPESDKSTQARILRAPRLQR